MKIHFLLHGIPNIFKNDKHNWYEKGKIAVVNYPELINRDLILNNEGEVQRALSRKKDLVLFVDSETMKADLLNLEWGWREYKLKKL